MKNLLPIGTVILLKEATKKIMIIGYLQVTEDNKTFDYSGVIYPEGSLSSDQSLLFNNEDIDKVFFNGYKNEEYDAFIQKVTGLLASNNNQ